ncbi:alpha-amylase family glycosyl hydrolase [Christiangramia flava]|uniref:1,4-alpha-glucan branching enzyme n=1 Tax=Christiangramia flava JLT2011 TaxID=1229726 RepID=A0A1L7HZJ4_9FLAO|nr:alpha-amylase family glycosyl hydrolase [Christiangramia flava]APU66760.1 Malto-oligosyltrehalose trehalohydrolase [Christiangramia flava JLT2011]OSS38397.1 Malto-oligosyltrehalose trehalohydrolase [Christiangramia flava JLT2011]
MEKELVKTVAPSAGMGAILEEGQTTFRVWAPNANAVAVVGDFNGWKADQLILENEGNGYWSGITSKANEGDQYKYLIQNGERSFYKNDPYAFEVTNSDGNSIIRTLNFDWENDAFQLPSWNQLVIYELHVGTFYRPDPGKVGTFDDVISKLPYLQKLGINCIELLPVAEFAGGISWGYNPAHPFAVEQDYGGPDGLFRLIKAAHHHGIGVIMDVVYNHFGPSDVDLWQFDGWSENDKGGIYFYNDHRSDTPWGNTRPDYGRPEVRQYLRDNALMWIEKYHCDGLRMDATSYIRYEGGGLGLDSEILEGMILMRDINNELHQKYPNVITIAEDLKSQSIVTNPIDKGGIGYGTQWDMNFVHPVREVLTNVNDQDRDLQKIIDALCYRYENDAYSRVIYTESHDEVANGKARVPEEIQPGDAESVFAKKRAILGIVLCLTAPGIPMLFQGQEFLEDEYFKDTEGLDWQKYERLKGIERMVTDLINFRKGAVPGLEALSGQHVEILHTDHENKVLAYKRYNEEHQSVLIILNFSSQDLQNYELQLQEDNWQLRFNSTWKGYDDSLSDLEVAAMEIEQLENKLEGKLDIPAYGALIFSR